MRKFLRDNSGVSLMELVVVISIMVVLGATATFSFRMVATRSASQCAENMRISLEKHRTSVMGQKNGRIAFYRDADGNIWMQEEFNYSAADPFPVNVNNATKIGKKDVEVTCNGTALSTTPVIITFERSGALKNGENNLPIVIKRLNRVYTINIDKLTGKIKLS